MTRRQRKWTWLAVFLTGGTVFQGVGFTRTGLGNGCGGFATNGLLLNGVATGFDFCYLLDCRNGFFGGAFQPCDPDNPFNSLLIDCGNVVPTNGGGTNDDDLQTQDQTNFNQGTNSGNLFGGGF